MDDKFLRGSEWRKWDLHTHTPTSILHNLFPKLANGEPDWEKYLLELEKTDIAVLGVTDYFTIEGYKKLREFREAGRLSNIQCLLPNIEFRLDKLVSSRHDGAHPRRINFHVIFSDEVSAQDIEEHFLYDIEFDYEGNPQAPDGTRKLKVSNIKELGERLIEEHAAFAGQDPLVLGASKVVVKSADIIKRLQDSRFKGKYVVVLPEELTNLIDWNGQDHLVRKVLLQQSDMVFSPNPKTREWCLGRHPYDEGEQKFVEEFKSLKPCLHGADAHELSQIGKPCAKRFGGHDCTENSDQCDMRHLWIKADPTFEGLKQLLCEPDDRVRIQPESPAPLRGGYTIDSFEIEGQTVSEELTVRHDKRPLNPGLVAVCGGRGAGKTAYVDLLANCFFERAASGDANSFVQRVNEPGVSIGTELGFKNGESFKKQSSDGQFFENSDVVYVAQGQLEIYIGEGSSLEKYVNDLVFASPPISKSVLEYEFGRIGNTISEIEASLLTMCESIARLETETAQDQRESLRLALARARADSDDLRQQASTLEKRIGVEKVQLAETQQRAIADLSDRKVKYEELQAVLEQAISYIKDELPRANALIKRANDLVNEVGLTKQVPEIEETSQALLSEHVETIRPMIVSLVQEIADAQQKLEGHEADVKEHAKLLERGRLAEANVKKRERETAEMTELVRELQKQVEARTTTLRSLFNAVMMHREKYSEIIKAFSDQRAEILADLDFIPEISFDEGALISRLGDVIDNRKSKVLADDPDGPVAALLTYFRSVAGGDVEAIDSLVEEIDKQALELGQQLRTSFVVDHSSFYRIMFSNYLKILPVVKYKGVGLNKLSLGQKATVLMKIYLAEGTKPIIIDSHDDHLDNEYIMDELISAIRQAKKLRQVLLVSNNANVVINSDAEQVIVARHSSGEITYESGSIESPEIRSLALEVLEGGADAFRRRQQKYRISS